jgi:CrcB protein
VSAALLVFLGGGLGSLARFGVGLLLGRPGDGAFPWATFTVNLVGSFALGILAGYAAQRATTDWPRTFLGIGVLGGFTTYSTFNQETLALVDARGPMAGGGYVLATVTACLVAGWCGGVLARRTFGPA